MKNHMKRTLFLLTLVCLCSVNLGGLQTSAADPPNAKSDEGKAAAETIQPIGNVEKVHDGFAFTEGPAWEPSGTLYFSDIPNTTIHRLAADDTLSVFTKQSAHTNGMLLTADGRLLACQMDGQVVAYDTESGKATVLAKEYDGKRFNAPNDLVLDASGGIYFTDPLFRAPTPLPQTIQAVYYIAADGTVSRVTQDIAAPNGIGLSPDGKHLYVCPSQQAEMLVYDVSGPGKLSQPRTFCAVKQPVGMKDTGADGIVLDEQGNVYITTHIGVQIFSPGGDAVGLVEFPEQPANVTFGGADRKTMYVTARTGLYRVAMPIAGLKPN
ncbi:SMP-30/gluconolactonase/LRE family protein [Stieleria varia]|uniref:Gluconolactonase n=1 Tax=Stieleria varia TaxID=2528005 RepID=A0A5C6AT78_9BACT|nr:SMP-30/gluconolactonase/LRE family protein [Stieleria varia]TWU02621.1 Gluconolactonase precursor [Stieleria varia]